MNKPSDEIVAEHDFRSDMLGLKVCNDCGMAMHNKQFQGFKYWYAGVGYREPPSCPYRVKRGE